MPPAEIYPIPGFGEPLSCFTHLAGAAFFAVLGISLLRRGWGDRGRFVSLLLFAVATVSLLAISGVYHLVSTFNARHPVMRLVDHAAIFILIAASFTPPHYILFRGLGRWGPLAMIWSASITALTLKMIFIESFPDWLGICVYLLLGWVGIFGATVMWRLHGFRFVQPLLGGALAYTFGAMMEMYQQPIIIYGVVGPHELFHLAVLAGVGFHWKFVFSFASGELPSESRPAVGEFHGEDRQPEIEVVGAGDGAEAA